MDDNGLGASPCGTALSPSVEPLRPPLVRTTIMDDREKLMGLAERCQAGTLKALSIKQPYPHHIFHDGKDVENRDWPTKGRGWFVVHAGVSKTELCMELPDHAAMPRGGIVGMARIVDCVSAMDSQWFYGKFGFVLADAFPVPLIPCRGQLGFFAPSIEVMGELAAALRVRTALSTEDTRND